MAKKNARKAEKYEPVVRIHGGKNRETGFYEFNVFESNKPTPQERFPDWNDPMLFVIRPAEGYYIAMKYDRNAHPSHTPQIQPEILGVRRRPSYAVKLLEKETQKYVRELMVKWGAKFLSSSGMRSLKSLDALWSQK